MLLRSLFFLLLCAAALSLTAQDTLAFDNAGKAVAVRQPLIWQELVSTQGRFRIKTPGYLTEKVDTLNTSLGLQTYHTFFYQSPDKEADNLFYMISYCDYPEGSIDVDSTELVDEFFDVTVKESAFSINGDLVYSNPIEWNGYPGRIWRVDYLKGSAVIKTRAYLVGNRYYAIQTVMLKDKSLNPSSDQFFNSFYLLDGAASGN